MTWLYALIPISLRGLAPRWPRRSRPIEVLTGVGFFVAIVAVYSDALRFHRLPPGHPWLPLAFACFGVSAIGWPSTRIWGEPRRQNVARLAVALLGFAALGMTWWTFPHDRPHGL